MKLIAFIFCIISFIVSDNVDTFSFNSTEYNFGEIAQNIPATATYELTNDSDIPLVIEHVKVGCGCTSSNYTKDPIQPGATAMIEAIYNAKKKGAFKKTVSVTTNLSDEPTVLSFEGEVVTD